LLNHPGARWLITHAGKMRSVAVLRRASRFHLLA